MRLPCSPSPPIRRLSAWTPSTSGSLPFPRVHLTDQPHRTPTTHAHDQCRPRSHTVSPPQRQRLIYIYPAAAAAADSLSNSVRPPPSLPRPRPPPPSRDVRSARLSVPRARRSGARARVRSTDHGTALLPQARDPAAGGRGACRHRPARRVEVARGTSGHGRVVVDGAKRARRARSARLTHAPSHLSRSRSDRERVSGLRRAARRVDRRPPGRRHRRRRDRSQRARSGAPVDHRDALAGNAPAGSRFGACARIGVRATRRRSPAAAAGSHRRRHHLDRRRYEAGAGARPSGRSGSRRLGPHLPRGTGRRAAVRLRDTPASPGGPALP